MRMTWLVVALRALARIFRPKGTEANRAIQQDRNGSPSERSPTAPENTGRSADNLHEGGTCGETPPQCDGQPVEPLGSDLLQDHDGANESGIALPGHTSDSIPREQDSPFSSSDADTRLPTSSNETAPEISTTTATTGADSDQRHEEPNTAEHREGKTPKKARKPERKPREIGGRRDRPRPNPNRQTRQSPSSRPELVCRRVPGSTRWEILLTTDEDCQLAAVHFEGTPLDFTDGQCPVPSLNGRLTASYQDGHEHTIPLFDGEPLIFKLRKNWAGEGPRTSRITRGHFIVIAPRTWRRRGHAPVEDDGLTDPAFRAHYFHRDPTVSDEAVGGFDEWSDSASVAAGIELTGQRIFDDSDDGELFVGDPPGLSLSPDIQWARVGKEAIDGWGTNFRPHVESLPEVLGEREGRFFLRVYDSELRMLDSVAFRHLSNLRQIHVNGADYAQDTALIPASGGHVTATVRFVGPDGSTLSPVLPVGAHQQALPSGAIQVPPYPDADRMTCGLAAAAGDVNVVVDLPRIWWRLEDGYLDPGQWRDTPLVMTREEFRSHARASTFISLLSKRQASVRVGFDRELDQPYRRALDDERIAIPLSHFDDHVQIDQRLYDDARLNVAWAGAIVPLILVSADPMPEVVSFTADPGTIISGRGNRARVDDAEHWTARASP